MAVNRREQLEEFLRHNPNDAFARYGLAMELMHRGESEAALVQFAQLQQQHPNYPAGFQQAGQLLLSLGRNGDAKTVLQRGLQAAATAGDRHAASEIQGLLDELAD
ncbi:MAG: tetratricopeptide repeat protein [Acidobacteria bacterium]|nr:MAG: tetratricopeptide repeat protein [Acidobacteriota bacterium]